jgi:hypothetical protein
VLFRSKGSTASSFEWRPYTTELQLCQRYYETGYPVGIVPGTVTSQGVICMRMASLNNDVIASYPFVVEKRASPSITTYSPNNGASGTVYDSTAGTNRNITGAVSNAKGIKYLNISTNAAAGALIMYDFVASAEL